jgi:monofunctional biosynthetic peptidoglycan transglycosylase
MSHRFINETIGSKMTVNIFKLHFFLMGIIVFFPIYHRGNSSKEVIKNVNDNQITLYDFKNPEEIEDWIIVNDGVMGGLSQSKIALGDSGTAIFQGNISLENNGGFASTRTLPRQYHLDTFTGLEIRVKGDGKTYQFRLREKDRFDGIAYRYHFRTQAGEWMTVRIPFEECIPVFRGRILSDVKPVSPEEIQQIGFLVSDKQTGRFQLEIDWIKAFK